MGEHHLPQAQARRTELGMITLATTDEAIRRCHDLIRQLRPHHDDPDRFVARVRLQQEEGYLLAALEQEGSVCAVAGYRYGHNLAWGKYLYVDDLVTDAKRRSRGHGKTALNWLLEQAREHDCDELHLDSGVQRFAAHRFYMRDGGMDIASHHFSRGVR